ncbi:hypothetical protein [Kribbella sp. NPDC055071]
MPDGEEKHLTTALGGVPGEPLSPDDRVERERVRTLLQSVASCYNSLVARETDADRQAELATQLALHDDQVRRQNALSAEERREIIRVYPALLDRLRAELDA